jgi:tetratricopeptide (TPR) repeat protein
LYRIPVYLFGGALEQAEQVVNQLEAGPEKPKPIFQKFYLANIALTMIGLGKLQEGEAVLEKAFATIDREAPFSFDIVPLEVADGHLQLAMGNPDGVLDSSEGVIHQLYQIDGRYYLAELLWLQGKAWLALEDARRAKEALLRAKSVAVDTGERTILWQILVELSDLEKLNGGEREAERLSCQAQEIIGYIAENAGSEEMRASFLAQPAVRRVLAET